MRTRLHVWVILAALGSATQPVRGQQPPAPPDTGVPAAAAPDAVATSGTTGAPVVSETLALQVMLDRAGFSPGEIDGKPGPNVKRALAAFQRAQGVAPSGDLEEDTWARLRAATGDVPPLSQYDITSADTDGPFTAAIPADLVAQSKLGALGYRTPLEALGEKFHASPRLLQELNPGVSF